MKQNRKKIKKEKKRLQSIQEQKDQRNIKKQNLDFPFLKKKNIRFKNPERKK
jgi:hypothetical protein